MEIGGARGQAPQDGALDAVDVAAQASDQRLAGIGGVNGVGSSGRRSGERIGAAVDLVDRQVGKVELRDGAGDERIGFVGGVVARADIERERKRVIADVGRVVAGGAVANERRDGGGAEGGVVVQAADAGDGERAGVEESFADGNSFAHGVVPIGEGEKGWTRTGPRVEEREGGGIEGLPVGILAEGIVGAGMVLLLGKNVSAAAGAIACEQACSIVVDLSRVQAKFKIDDGGLLIEGRGGALGMSNRGTNGLMHEVGDEIGAKGLGVIERLYGFAAVEHDGAEKTEVGGGERAAVNGDSLCTGRGIGNDGTAVGVVDGTDGELSVAGKGEEDPDEAAFQKQAVVGRISGSGVGTVGTVNGSEERVVAAGFLEGGADTGDAEAKGVAGEMASGAGAAVGTETLKEGVLFVDRTRGVVGRNQTGWVAKRKQAGDDDCGGNCC